LESRPSAAIDRAGHRELDCIRRPTRVTSVVASPRARVEDPPSNPASARTHRREPAASCRSVLDLACRADDEALSRVRARRVAPESNSMPMPPTTRTTSCWRAKPRPLPQIRIPLGEPGNAVSGHTIHSAPLSAACAKGAGRSRGCAPALRIPLLALVDVALDRGDPNRFRTRQVVPARPRPARTRARTARSPRASAPAGTARRHTDVSAIPRRDTSQHDPRERQTDRRREKRQGRTHRPIASSRAAAGPGGAHNPAWPRETA
jgi:hypothetical protein